MEAININTRTFFLSFSYNAGLINFQSSQRIKGNASINPAVIHVQINMFI